MGETKASICLRTMMYDLRAIPTVYLLAKDRKVLLKDCLSVREIEKHLLN